MSALMLCYLLLAGAGPKWDMLGSDWDMLGAAATRPTVPKTSGVAFFTAKWCVRCPEMHPLVERLKRQGRRVWIVEDTQVNQATGKLSAVEWRVMAYPTMIAIRRGSEVRRIVGVTTYEQLEQLSDEAEEVKRPANPPLEVPVEVQVGRIIPSLMPQLPTTPDCSTGACPGGT